MVTNTEEKSSMNYVANENRLSKKFPYARFATNVTFQQCNRPMGNHQESKSYYSAKHKLYGYKVEVPVFPT